MFKSNFEIYISFVTLFEKIDFTWSANRLTDPFITVNPSFILNTCRNLNSSLKVVINISYKYWLINEGGSLNEWAKI